MAATKIRSVPTNLTHVAISASDSADLVAAVTGKKIIVWRMFVRTGDATKSLKFQSGATTDLTGAMLGTSMDFHFMPAGGMLDGTAGIPIFETVAGEKLNVVASAAVAIAGF